MANNKLDDFDFDDFNFDNLDDIASGRPRRVRDDGPVRKLASNFGEGAKEAITDPNVLRRLAAAALPDGYGTAINATNDILDGGQELYNIAARELRPALPAMRRTAGRIAESGTNLLPQALRRKLKRFSEQTDGPRMPSEEEMQNQQILNEVGAVFAAGVELQARHHAVDQAERRVRERMNEKLTVASIRRQDAMVQGIQRLVSYQDQVTHKYQQKSLELQYRQLFATQAILKLEVSNQVRDREFMNAILRNTAMSDGAKARFEQTAGSSYADRLKNQFTQGIAKHLGEFGKKIKANITNTVRSTISGMGDFMTAQDDAAQMMADAEEMGMDMSASGEGAKMAGRWMTENLLRLIAGPVRGKVSKNKNVTGFGARLNYLFQNMPEHITSWSKTRTDNDSVWGDLINVFKDMVPRQGLDHSFGVSVLQSADEPATFNMQTRRSITEVIPGFLSRIHHELQIMRTGDDSLDPVTYNMTRGTFSSKSAAKSDMMRQLFNPRQVGLGRDGLNEFIDKQIDPEGKLSPQARKALMRQLMHDTASGEVFRPERYIGTDFLTPELVGDEKEEVERLVKARFQTGDRNDNNIRVNDAAVQFKKLRNLIIDPKSAMSVFRDAGQKELLIEMGLVKSHNGIDTIDFAKVMDLVLNDAESEGPGGLQAGRTALQAMQDRINGKMDRGAQTFKDIFSNGLSHPDVQKAMGGLKAAGNAAAGLGRSGVDKFRDVCSSHGTPLLQSVKLRAGEYRDQLTGKVLTSIQDIRGPVVDRFNSVVLSASDLAAGLQDQNGQSLDDIAERARANITALHTQHVGPMPVPSQGEAPQQVDQLQVQQNFEATNQLVDLNTQQVELLKVIAEILVQNGAAQGGGGPPSGPMGYLDRLVVGGLKKGWTGVKFLGKAYGAYLRGLGKGAMAIGTGAVKAVTGIGGTALEILKGPMAGARDIYVKGGDTPVLTAYKMKRGHYQDVKTSKRVKALKDITGAVIDISENGEMALTQEQFDEGIFARGPNGFIRVGLKAIGGAAKGLVSGYFSLFKVPVYAMQLTGKALVQGMKMMVNDQVDVYVLGEMQRPRLRAVLMRSGKYYSAKTGKLIRGFKDIDGPVKELVGGGMKASAQDLEVISEEDIKKGLVNAYGKPLRTGMQRLLGMAGSLAGGVGSFVAGAGRFYGKLVGGAFGLMGDLFGGSAKRFGAWFNPKEFGAQSSKQTKLLEQIYELLDARMPKGPPKKGSYEDQMAAFAAAKREKNSKKEEAEKEKKSGFGAFLNWMKGAGASLFGGGDEEEEGDGDDGDTTIIGGGGGGDDKDAKRKRRMGRAKAAARRKGKLGWLFRGKDKLGGLFKGAGSKLGRFKPRGLGLGGIASGLAMGMGGSYLVDKLGGENSTAGRAANTAVNVAGTATTAWSLASMLGLGSGAAAGGAAAGGAAATAGGVAGAGALATIGLPVLIGAAVVGAVAYAGYKAFKKYKYGTYIPLRAYRMAQYGVPYSDASMVEKIVDLEQMVEPHTKNMGTGLDIAASDQLKMKDIYDHFGIDDGWFSDNSKERTSFDVWFNKRFKPVYLGWMSALKTLQTQKAARLNDLDDELQQTEKAELLKRIKSAGASGYGVMAGPDGDDLEIGPSEIEDAYLLAQNTIEKEKTTGGKATSMLKRIGTASAVMGPLGMFGGTAMMDWVNKKRDAMDVADIKERNGAAAVKGAIGAAGVAAGAAIKGGSGLKGVKLGASLSALEAVRFRTYGLTDMDTDRVRALAALERDVVEMLQFNTDGTAVFQGDPKVLYEEFCGLFGLSARSGSQRSKWVDWFEARFMPTLIAFATAVRQYSTSGNALDAANSIKPEQRLEVAQAVMGAKRSVMGFKISVWSYDDSPWGKEPLNTDMRTVHDNLMALREAIKKRTMPEDKGKDAGGKGASGKASTAGADQAAKAQGSFMDRMRNWFAGTTNTMQQGFSNISNAAGNAYTAAKSAVYGAYESTKSALGFGGEPMGPMGTIAVQPGNGTGGDINKIPIPQKSGRVWGWGDVQGTILAAARMVGVDPQLMATIANIESGFNPNAKAPTSSASGLYQFINDTWKGMLKKYGSKYGIAPGTSQFDPRANALLGAEFLRENMQTLKKYLKRPITDTDLYTAHFMGADTAGRMLSRDPNADAVALYPKAARANQSIFFNKSGGSRTIGEVIAELDRRVNARRIRVAGGAANTVTQQGATAGGKAGTAAGPATAQAPKAGATPAGTTDGSAAGKPPIGTGFASTPVPSIDRSAGLQQAGSNGAAAQDAAITQSRQAAAQAAAANDVRGRAANESADRQMSQVVTLMKEQLIVQKDIASNMRQAVAALGSLKGSAIAAAGSSPTGVADNKPSASPRQERGTDTLPQPAVSMQRRRTG